MKITTVSFTYEDGTSVNVAVPTTTVEIAPEITPSTDTATPVAEEAPTDGEVSV